MALGERSKDTSRSFYLDLFFVVVTCDDMRLRDIPVSIIAANAFVSDLVPCSLVC